MDSQNANACSPNSTLRKSCKDFLDARVEEILKFFYLGKCKIVGLLSPQNLCYQIHYVSVFGELSTPIGIFLFKEDYDYVEQCLKEKAVEIDYIDQNFLVKKVSQC